MFSTPSLSCNSPRMEKMTTPAMMLVRKSRLLIANAWMWTLVRNLLYDPNMMSPPHDTESEKNICSAAFRHTEMSSSLSHLGKKKNLQKVREMPC